VEVVIHSDGDPPVGLLAVKKWHSEPKRHLVLDLDQESEPKPAQTDPEQLSSSSSSPSLVLYVDEVKALEFALAAAATSTAAAEVTTTSAVAAGTTPVDHDGDGDDDDVVVVHVSGDQVLVSGITAVSTSTSTSATGAEAVAGGAAGGGDAGDGSVNGSGGVHSGNDESDAVAASQMHAILKQMENVLTQSSPSPLCSGGLKDVTFVHLYLRNMDRFAAVSKGVTCYFFFSFFFHCGVFAGCCAVHDFFS
jgi:hypothetical protein